MTSTATMCAICLVVCHVSFAVILRPKWYPYFPRHNPAPGESDLRSDFASLTDTMAYRQARTTVEDVPLCQDNLTNEECLNKIILVISRLLQLRSRKDYF